MADNLSTPRITSSYLDEFRNKTVRITGKVTQLRGETATIDSEGVVTAHLNRVRVFSLPAALSYFELGREDKGRVGIRGPLGVC
jgi:hypothetical protein